MSSVMPHPFAEFFASLQQAGIPINLRDYYRVHQALSGSGEWTLSRLERVLGALLANDAKQVQAVRRVFRCSFDTQWQGAIERNDGALDIVVCRAALQQLLAAVPDNVSHQPVAWEPLPSIPEPVLPPKPPSDSFFKKYRVWLAGLACIIALVCGAFWMIPIHDPTAPTPPVITEPTIVPTPSVTTEPTIVSTPQPTTGETVTITPDPKAAEVIMVDVNTYDPASQKKAEESRTAQLRLWFWLSGLFAALSVGLFAYWRWQNRPLEVLHLKSSIDAEITQDFFDDSRVGGAPADWLSRHDIDQVAEQLQYIQTDTFTDELAIDSSIQETIAAGFSQLRFAVKKTLQPVLILVNLTPRQLAWYTVAEELTEGLRARGVNVTLGYCRRNFDYFIDELQDEYELIEWREDHPDARLLIFLDTQTNQAIESVSGTGWAQWLVLTLRDRLQWDYREARLLEQQVPLYSANPEQLLQGMDRQAVPRPFVTEHYQSFELCRHGESDEAYCRRVLGRALPLAVALSSYPRSWSLAMADVLRRQYFVSVNRLHLQRLLRLCDTGMGHSFRFEARWQAVLLAYHQQQPDEAQNKVKQAWLGLLEGCEPQDKDSNAWAGWQWRKSLLVWNDDPDEQTAVIAGLLTDFPDFKQTIQQQSSRWVEQPEAVLQPNKHLPRSRKGKQLFKQLLLPEGVRSSSQRYFKQWQPQWSLLASLVLLVSSLGMGYQVLNTSVVVDMKVQQEALLIPDMADIPAGTFMMGCVEGVDDAGDLSCSNAEKPAHSVTVAAFQMGKYEVTHVQYVQFLNAVGRHGEKGKEWFKTKAESDSSHITEEQGHYRIESGFEDHPVIYVSWYGAQAYISWLNEVDKVGGWRLPSEAEWEYAVRGNSEPRSAYFWGNTIGENNANCENSICKGEYDTTSPVGSFKQPEHPWGLFDMHGNVWEWTDDCWVNSYQNAAKDKTGVAFTDCDSGVSHVLRGGSWYNNVADYLRSANRDDFIPNYRNINVGFRLSRTRFPLSAPNSELPKGQSAELINGSGDGAVNNEMAQQVAPAVSPVELSIEMVDIPAGTFTMGCVEGVDDAGGLSCSDDEKPAHSVTVAAFQMGKYEVTHVQYVQFLNAVGRRGEKGKEWFETKVEDDSSHIIEEQGRYRIESGFEDHPVINVSWYGAQAYINWLNEVDKVGGWRLPSEAEWEYAARGNSEPRSAYFWGSTIGENNANCRNSICKDEYDTTSPVGSFKQPKHPCSDSEPSQSARQIRLSRCEKNYSSGYF